MTRQRAAHPSSSLGCREGVGRLAMGQSQPSADEKQPTQVALPEIKGPLKLPVVVLVIIGPAVVVVVVVVGVGVGRGGG